MYRERALASGLSTVAGFVDGVGFLITGGFFVSFMSGNSTRLAVSLAEGSPSAFLALGLIGSFVLGVSAGAVVGRKAPRRAPAVLGFVTLLLVIAAAISPDKAHPAAIFLLAFAMGAENTVFASNGEVRFGVTYMTGALVKLGKGLTAAVLDRNFTAWVSPFILWFGLISGAALGAVAFDRLGAQALWIAAGLMGFLTLMASAAIPEETRTQAQVSD
ncbi:MULTISPECIES: YoaK family protein [Phenylobacterium]|uniref:Uncharacterized membrane protein YoaK (UPF0700 family) n=1 Tax=Phenylobacterium koreense TaxID=266125 RepID=A0ABV2EI92_9CAUL